MTQSKPRHNLEKPRKQINIRASKMTMEQLQDIIRWWDANQSEVIALAIDRLHREESKKYASQDAENQEDISKL